MAEWTRTMIEDRIETAAEVFNALPGVKPQGYFSAWPEYFHTFGDKVTQQPEARRPRPSPRAITEAEATLLWLRANRTQWKPICWELGISRATASRRWEYALSVITWRLNGRKVPRKRSMAFVVTKTAP